MEQLNLFDEIDNAAAEREAKQAAKQAALMEEARKPKQCTNCGEWSPNEYLWKTNHGEPEFYDLPGSCMKHWMMFNQAKWSGHEKMSDHAAAAESWLIERGFALPTQPQRDAWQGVSHAAL